MYSVFLVPSKFKYYNIKQYLKSIKNIKYILFGREKLSYFKNIYINIYVR